MGYRLTPADVEACPRFPQVEKIKQQLSIVDYTVLEGETGENLYVFIKWLMIFIKIIGKFMNVRQ